MTNMLTPEEWMDEIRDGLEYRRQFAMEDAWNKLELDYINDPTSDCAIGPNLIYSMGDSLLSGLTVPDPEILLTANHPNAVKRKPILEATDNWLIKKMMMKEAIEDAILNSYLFSRAILKIGYDSEYGWSPYYDIGKGNNLMGMTLTQFDKRGNRIETGATTPGMPWVAAVSPHDIVVPWGTKSIETAPWIAHRVVRLTDHIKKDPKYRNTSRLESDVSMESFMDSYGHVMASNRRSIERSNASHASNIKSIFNILWEIHDRMTGRIFVISTDYDKFIRNGVDALQIDGLPFVSSTLIRHPRSFWSTPQAYYLGQIQNTSSDIAKQEEKTRRINVLKFLINANVISEDEMNKAMSGDVGAVALAKTNMPLKDAVMPFPQGSTMQFDAMANNNRSDARDAIGFSRNQLGEFDSSSRRTAREATFVQQGSQTRSSRRMGAVTKLYIDTIRKVNKIIFRYWKTPRHILTDGKWIQFTGEELAGDYLYDITLSTKRHMSSAERKMESMMMVSQLAQIPGIDINAMKQYVSDASGDPAFEQMLGIVQGGSQKGQQALPAAKGSLPTIPATKTEK